MSDQELIDALTNAFGSSHFDLESAMAALKEQCDRMQERGENAGSVLALMNILPEIEDECKRRY